MVPLAVVQHETACGTRGLFRSSSVIDAFNPKPMRATKPMPMAKGSVSLRMISLARKAWKPSLCQCDIVARSAARPSLLQAAALLLSAPARGDGVTNGCGLWAAGTAPPAAGALMGQWLKSLVCGRCSMVFLSLKQPRRGRETALVLGVQSGAGSASY